MFEGMKDELVKNIKEIRSRENLTNREKDNLVLLTTMEYIKKTKSIIRGEHEKD